MSTLWCVVIIGAALAGAASYLSAYSQLSHAYVRKEARRRALGAVPGPMVFYAVLGGILTFAAPLTLHR